MEVKVVETSANFLAINIETFRKAIRDINFDVFLRLSDDNFAHVFSKSTGLDYKRLAHYIKRGVKELYIRKGDEPAYKIFLEMTPQSVLMDPEAPKGQKIATLINMTEQNMSELFEQLSISETTAENTRKVVQNYVTLMAENPSTLDLILKLASLGDHLYYHSISVAIIAMFIAKVTGMFNRRMLEMIGLGGLLHDIGCTQIPPEIIDNPGRLSPAEWKVMASHPRLGLRMMEKTHNIPDEVRYIIYQHHEEQGGNGYPNGLKGSAIYFPAKIVAVADAFSALVSRRPFRDPYEIEQAINIIQSEPGKYDPALVEILAGLFLRTGLKAA